MPSVLIVIGVILLVGLIWLLVNYNRLVRVRQHVRESWADIEVELKRRYDLIPNLVQTVKGYAAHERSVLEEVTKLRDEALASRGSAAAQAVDETALMIGLKKLFVRVEAYPELKADTHFLALQKELALTEDRIAASRRFYNANIREMRQLCEQIPTNMVASTVGFQAGDFFELESAAERVVPRI